MSSLKLNLILFWTLAKVHKKLRTETVQAILIYIIRFAQLTIHYDAFRFPKYILKAFTAVVANNCSTVDSNQHARPPSAPSLLV